MNIVTQQFTVITAVVLLADPCLADSETYLRATINNVSYDLVGAHLTVMRAAENRECRFVLAPPRDQTPPNERKQDVLIQWEMKPCPSDVEISQLSTALTPKHASLSAEQKSQQISVNLNLDAYLAYQTTADGLLDGNIQGVGLMRDPSGSGESRTVELAVAFRATVSDPKWQREMDKKLAELAKQARRAEREARCENPEHENAEIGFGHGGASSWSITVGCGDGRIKVDWVAEHYGDEAAKELVDWYAFWEPMERYAGMSGVISVEPTEQPTVRTIPVRHRRTRPLEMTLYYTDKACESIPFFIMQTSFFERIPENYPGGLFGTGRNGERYKPSPPAESALPKSVFVKERCLVVPIFAELEDVYFAVPLPD